MTLFNHIHILYPDMDICLLHICLFFYIYIQPGFIGSRTKHSETITSGLLKMNQRFVLLFAGVMAVIKVLVNLQTALQVHQRFPSAENVKGLCSVRTPSDLLPVKGVLQKSISERPVAFDLQELH